MGRDMKRYIKYMYFKIKEKYNYFKNLKLVTGIKFSDYLRLKYGSNVNASSIFGKKIQITNSFWHLHSINEIFIDETYKFHTENPEPLILDCGSNIGLSIIYLKRLHPNAKIIGFEPDPTIFKMLNENLNQFDFYNITIENKAVWIGEGELTFNNTGSLGGKLNTNDLSTVAEVDKNNPCITKTIRLKEYLKNQKVDFLKIDVEGAEFQLLDDCLDELKNVEKIFIEYHRDNGSHSYVGDFISKLEKCGFTIYIKEAWNNLPHPYCSDNFNPMYDLQLNIFGYRK